MKVNSLFKVDMDDNPSFKKATIALGQWIAKNGHTLVYGGSKMGADGGRLFGKWGRGSWYYAAFLKDREMAFYEAD